jgi:hypothetical protein
MIEQQLIDAFLAGERIGRANAKAIEWTTYPALEPGVAAKQYVEDLPSPPTSNMQTYIDVWNKIAVPAGLPATRKLSPQRKRAIERRLKHDPDLLESFTEAVTNMVTHPHPTGKTDAKWKADFDFMFQPSRDQILRYQEMGALETALPVNNKHARKGMFGI